MGFESINQPGQSSEVECNPETSIAFYWLEMGGGWVESINQPGWSSEVNTIQKEAFHFIGWRWVADGVQVHQSARQIIRSERNLKTSISFFLAGEGWQMGFESINQPSRSSEVEHNPKSSISFFWLERAGRWGSSPLTSQADHQNLNVFQKWAFHFISWRGVADRVRVHRPAWPIIRSWT